MYGFSICGQHLIKTHNDFFLNNIITEKSKTPVGYAMKVYIKNVVSMYAHTTYNK